MRWDPTPHIIRRKERELRPRPNISYLSGQNPMEGRARTWGSPLVGAPDVGPWVGEPKPLGKTPFGGNPSPDITYPPTFS